jgi:threonine dehydratase
MITLQDVQAARPLIAPYTRRTPLEHSQTLSQLLGTEVYLKLELFQKTGSFKPRGAINQIMALDPAARARGIVGVSGGNFAQGAAYGGAALGLPVTIVMPEFTPRNYIEATQGYGAKIDLMPDLAACFARVEDYREQGFAIVHPYDHPYQAAGNGVAGLEVVEDLPDVTDVFISIGGGGLIYGMGVAIQSQLPQVRIWGVETEGAQTMNEALKAGQVVHIKPTSLARTLGAPYVCADALDYLKGHLHRMVIVSDVEAIAAQRYLLERVKVLTELAAACTLAAAQKVMGEWGENRKVVLMLCGGNESVENIKTYSVQGVG